MSERETGIEHLVGRDSDERTEVFEGPGADRTLRFPTVADAPAEPVQEKRRWKTNLATVVLAGSLATTAVVYNSDEVSFQLPADVQVDIDVDWKWKTPFPSE